MFHTDVQARFKKVTAEEWVMSANFETLCNNCRPYLWFKDFELAASLGSAEQLASVAWGNASEFWNPLLDVPIHIQIPVGVIPLTLLLSEAFPYGVKLQLHSNSFQSESNVATSKISVSVMDIKQQCR